MAAVPAACPPSHRHRHHGPPPPGTPLLQSGASRARACVWYQGGAHFVAVLMGSWSKDRGGGGDLNLLFTALRSQRPPNHFQRRDTVYLQSGDRAGKRGRLWHTFVWRVAPSLPADTQPLPAGTNGSLALAVGHVVLRLERHVCARVRGSLIAFVCACVRVCLFVVTCGCIWVE